MNGQPDATAVWNRAADFMAGEAPADVRTGDRRLAEALAVDGAIQANGLSQAFETVDVAAGIEAFRWFGVDIAADLLSEAQSALVADKDGEADEALSARYYALDTETLLTVALNKRLRSAPDEFLPLR